MSLFVIYSIFGVFVIPKIVESQLQNNLKTLANWNTHVEHIRFNPFALSLELEGAQITENNDKPVISFDRLFINFSLLQSLGGAIAFDEISLDDPVINLDVDETGTTNFQKAFSSNEAEDTTTEEGIIEEDTGIVNLFFDLIAINAGKVNLSDDSQGENFSLTLEPLSLALKDFSTSHNEGGDYELSIALSNNQEIKWHGQFGIAPFQSKGHLALKNIHSSSFWHYAKTASPYWLNRANISLSGDYDTSISGEITKLIIENSELVIEDAVLSETSESEAFLAFKNLKLAPIAFGLNELSLDLGYIELTEPQIFIERAADASLNILRPLSSDTKNAETPELSQEETKSKDMEGKDIESQTEAAAFHWHIADIIITDGLIKWHDLALSSPTELNLEDIDITIGSLSDDLSQAFPYTLSFAFQNEDLKSDTNNTEAHELKKQTLSGSLSPQPFVLNGDADISNFHLASLQGYISESANIAINKGQFSLTSNYALSLNDQLSGSITSTAIIDKLEMTDTVLNKTLSGFKQLVLGPVSVSLPSQKDTAANVEIEAIILDQPFGELFIDEEGRVNLSHIVKKMAEDKALDDPQETEVTQIEPEPASPELLLKLFEIKQGKFTYTDSSMKPAVVTQLSDLSGTIEGISSKLEAKSNVSFTGKVDSQGVLDVKGTLNPLSKTPNTDIKIKVNNVNLSMASPYSAKYAGYQIDKGKLDLDLNYLIDGNKLKANNQILLNQFEFGKSVDSPDATSLPLPLALGILKDRKGKIDIDLPISGDLDDPSFKISSVILNTFINLISKAVTSPFSILGSLIEGGDAISEVQFIANSSELKPEQSEQILALAKALQQRPKLTLEIRGIADANIDQIDSSVKSEPELIQLAKERATQMSNFIIEVGKVDAARVFVLEPEIITLKPEKAVPEKATTISSKFTLGVR
tara:strand:+ start:12428 stop:15211 length:2784 start_codon:yes stop_codon:yes gene_type:complete